MFSCFVDPSLPQRYGQRHLGTAYEAHHAKQINIGSRKKNMTLRSIAVARTTPTAIAVPARTIFTELIETKRL